MRSALGKAVRRRFSARLARELPQFEEIKNEEIPPLCRLYGWAIGLDLTFYLMLQLHRTRDWFTVEIGWSLSGQFPKLVRMPASPHGAIAAAEMCFRLSRLWEAPQKDVWWELAPRLSPLDSTFDGFMNEPPVDDLLPKVDSVVEDAVKRILTDGMPYFRSVANVHGYQITNTGDAQ